MNYKGVLIVDSPFSPKFTAYVDGFVTPINYLALVEGMAYIEVPSRFKERIRAANKLTVILGSGLKFDWTIGHERPLFYFHVPSELFRTYLILEEICNGVLPEKHSE